MRINKYIALCGMCSRRAAEEYILQGKVTVNGKTVDKLSCDINERVDIVRLDGKIIEPPKSFTYIMFHKPKGCICSSSDESGRKTVFDYIDIDKRLFTVGRLDYDTEGLLLITDDGGLCNKLTHPSTEIGKTYIVKIEGGIDKEQLAALRKGVVLDDGFKTSKAKIEVLETEKQHTRLEVTIHEGHNRQIKRMFSAVGKNVVFIKRIKIGELSLGGLQRGKYRHLKKNEIEYLKNA